MKCVFWGDIKPFKKIQKSTHFREDSFSFPPLIRAQAIKFQWKLILSKQGPTTLAENLSAERERQWLLLQAEAAEPKVRLPSICLNPLPS